MSDICPFSHQYKLKKGGRHEVDSEDTWTRRSAVALQDVEVQFLQRHVAKNDLSDGLQDLQQNHGFLQRMQKVQTLRLESIPVCKTPFICGGFMTEPKRRRTAVIFDIGGVLLKDIWPEMQKRLADEIGVTVEEFDDLERGHVQDLQRGTISEERFWRIVCGKIDAQLPARGHEETSPIRWASQGLNEPNPIMIGTVRRLKSMGYKTGIISNIDSASVKVVEGFGIHEPFDEVVYSCDVGFIKPERQIYDIALERLGVLPHDAIFIDDRPENVAAARDYGFAAHLFEDALLARKFLGEELEIPF